MQGVPMPFSGTHRSSDSGWATFMSGLGGGMFWVSYIHTKPAVGQCVSTASRTEFRLGDLVDPGSSLDLMTSQFGDSGLRPAPPFPHLQNGSTNPFLPRLPPRVIPERLEKDMG